MINIQTLKPKSEEERKIFKPINQKQSNFMYSLKTHLLLSGAVRASKTFLGCWKGLMLNLKYPGNRGLICRKANASLPESTLLTLFTQVLPTSWIVKHNQSLGIITHLTPVKGVLSTISYGGLDRKAGQETPSKIGSTTYGWIFGDEITEFDKGDYEMLVTRLNYQIPRYTKEQNDLIPRQIFGATNPDAPTHWVYKFFFECTGEEKKERDVFLMTPYENIYLPRSYIKSLETTLAGVNKERLLFGKWVSAEGTIYKAFDVRKHVVDTSKLLINNLGQLEITTYKRVIFAADANFPLPRAGLLIGIRGDGSVDIIDEFYKENSQVKQLGEWVQTWALKLQRGIQGYHDPSAADNIDELNNMQNIICDKANNAVSAGIEEVTRYLENDLIRVNQTCVNLIRELQSYIWVKNSNPQIPKKENDHAVDALRYGLLSIKSMPAGSRGRCIM